MHTWWVWSLLSRWQRHPKHVSLLKMGADNSWPSLPDKKTAKWQRHLLLSKPSLSLWSIPDTVEPFIHSEAGEGPVTLVTGRVWTGSFLSVLRSAQRKAKFWNSPFCKSRVSHLLCGFLFSPQVSGPVEPMGEQLQRPSSRRHLPLVPGKPWFVSGPVSNLPKSRRSNYMTC